MDPVSFASAAASLLGVTVQITGSLYGQWDYSSRLLAERLIYELSQLRNVLQSLELTALSLTQPIIVSKDLLICLHDIKDALVSLGSKLLASDSSQVFSFQRYDLPWNSFGTPGLSRATKLPFTPSAGLAHVHTLHSYLVRLRGNIERSVCLWSETLAPKHTVDPTGTLWQNCAEYIETHQSARQTRLENTGIWFIAHATFRRWLVGASASNILFCPGKPGSGKTLLTALAIDRVRTWQQRRRSSNTGLAYFYFSYRKPSPIPKVVLSLLHQLHLQSLSPVDELTELEGHAAKSEHVSFTTVMSALMAVTRRFATTYIVLDALDECAADEKQDLLRLLTSIKDSPIRLLAFSRPDQTFNILDSSPKLEIFTRKEDVEHYCTVKLRRSRILVSHQDLLDKVISALVDLSERLGRFLPVVLQIDAILQKTSRRQIEDQLEQLPQNLQAVYQDSLTQIKMQKPRLAQLAKFTLTWLFYSQRPLEMAELLEILRFLDPVTSDITAPLIVEACKTLVQTGETIDFTHFSVKEFLESTRDAIWDESFVAAQCMRYLIECNVGQATTQESVDHQTRNHPFLLYAASFWGRHVRSAMKSNNADHETEMLEELCSVLLNDLPRVRILCHIVFMSARTDAVAFHGLIKSSWLHLVSHFGLDWAIHPPLVETETTNEVDEWERTPLHLAAANGFIDCVTLLLTKESQCRQDFYGRTVWHHAAMSGNPETMRCLIAFNSGNSKSCPHSSDGLKVDKLGKSPLEYAAKNGNASAFGMLLSMYTSESSSHLRTDAFRAALDEGKTEIVDRVLSEGEDIQYEYLLRATKTGFEDTVRLLIDYGSDVDNPDEDGDSAQHVAAREGQNRMLQFLLLNGAKPHRHDRHGQKALDIAIKMGNAEGVEILLQARAKPEISINNEKFEHFAVAHDQEDIVQLVLAPGADPLAKAWRAAKTGSVEILQNLLKLGLLPDPNSHDGRSLINIARESAQSFILYILQPRGSEVSPLPAYSILTEDAVETAASLHNVVSPDEEATPQTEAASEATVASDEQVEELSSKISQEEESAARLTTEQPDGASLPMLTLHSINNRRSAPVSAQPTVQDDSEYVRSLDLIHAAVPFLLLSLPIPAGSITLGTIVADPADPLLAYVPKNNTPLFKLVGGDRYELVQSDSQTTKRTKSTSKFAFEVLQQTLNLGETQNRVVETRSTSVVRQQLRNHEQVLSRILHDPLMRQEIFESAKRIGKEELCMVVGILVATDLHAGRMREYKTAAESGTNSNEAALSETPKAIHQGDKIFAISYRSIKFQQRSVQPVRGGQCTVSEVFVEDYFIPKPHERLS